MFDIVETTPTNMPTSAYTRKLENANRLKPFIEEFSNKLTSSLDPYCENSDEFLMAINAKDDVMSQIEKDSLMEIFTSIRREVRTLIKHRLFNDIKKEEGLLEAIATQLNDDEKRLENERVEKIREEARLAEQRIREEAERKRKEEERKKKEEMERKTKAENHQLIRMFNRYFEEDEGSVVNMSAIDLHLVGVRLDSDFIRDLSGKGLPVSESMLDTAVVIGLVDETNGMSIEEIRKRIFKMRSDLHELRYYVKKSDGSNVELSQGRKTYNMKQQYVYDSDFGTPLRFSLSAQMLVGYKCKFMPELTTISKETLEKDWIVYE